MREKRNILFRRSRIVLTIVIASLMVMFIYEGTVAARNEQAHISVSESVFQESVIPNYSQNYGVQKSHPGNGHGNGNGNNGHGNGNNGHGNGNNGNNGSSNGNGHGNGH